MDSYCYQILVDRVEELLSDTAIISLHQRSEDENVTKMMLMSIDTYQTILSDLRGTMDDYNTKFQGTEYKIDPYVETIQKLGERLEADKQFYQMIHSTNQLESKFKQESESKLVPESKPHSQFKNLGKKIKKIVQRANK